MIYSTYDIHVHQQNLFKDHAFDVKPKLILIYRIPSFGTFCSYTLYTFQQLYIFLVNPFLIRLVQNSRENNSNKKW